MEHNLKNLMRKVIDGIAIASGVGVIAILGSGIYGYFWFQGNKDALKGYNDWFNSAVENLPGVHHYSWFDLERKINTYKNYWSKHWQSLYNIEQDDTPENNMLI